MTAERPPVPAHGVSFGEALRVWARVALLSFGGPAGQIAVMHRILVDEKRWIGERRFLHALNFCMLLPGPEAQQLATYLGWLMHRTAGGLAAGLLFILPGAVSILALSGLYVLYGDLPVVEALFFGLKAAVLVVVVQALIRLGGRTLRTGLARALAAAAFLAIYAFSAPFPLIVLAAALTGLLAARLDPGVGGSAHGAEASDAERVPGEGAPDHARPRLGWALRISAVLLVLWLAPVLALGLGLGWDHVFTQIAVFFSKLAVVTFGGAYAVLAYVAQAAVETHGWLSPGEMIDGLGLAETTPGPLIMVTQFVGFLAAFRGETGLPPLLAGVIGAALTTWVTFTPCFLWIFLGAPYVEALRRVRALSAALSAVSAAVVGVILNLALWFGARVLFSDVGTFAIGPLSLDAPRLASLQPVSLVLVAASGLAAWRLRLGVLPLIGGAAAAGTLAHLAGLA
ncbi:chromate efflux transporter [Phenylobacterium sp.]|uniref:chromate efflux transporter n=1 Tax=Phenylobacterium sp. TaxID=1871053 RepID=UPI0025E46BDB|nr:chromate efflux transporter [Phenylobacterium sp.]